MTKVLLPIISILFSTYSYSQSQTLENGVVVHTAIGMEGEVTLQPETNVNRTISVWNLSECHDALAAIDLKCQDLSAEACNERYATIRLQIATRISELQTVTE